MQLHELKSNSGRRQPQRVGRGGKRGTTAGRGTKGQKSRSGRRIRPASRDLIIRIPKRRGFRNKSLAHKAVAVNLGELKALKSRADGKTPLVVTRQLLQEAGILPLRYRGEVKILGTGEAGFPVAFQGLKVSESAKAKIEKAGGKVA